jgi:two-component system sensor histidine kinase AlgZ
MTARRFFLRELPVDLGWCLLIAVVLTLLFSAFLPSALDKWFEALMLNFVMSLGIGLSVANSYRFGMPWLLGRTQGRLAYALGQVALLAVGVGFGVEISIRVIRAIGGPPLTDMRGDAWRIGLVVSTIAVALNISFDRLRNRARQVELSAEIAKKEALRAQLEALQARTDPHFLFNSLNTVAGLIEEDSQAAERILVKLSSLFRYSLEGAKTTWVRLGKELEAVSDYLEVEGMRLGERLRFSVEVEPGVDTILVPPLILQPLVENAVLHAVATRREGGRIRVVASRNGSSLGLTVADDGPGLGNSSHHGTGTSVADLRQRLNLIYGDGAKIDSDTPDEGGCRVRLTLPLELEG